MTEDANLANYGQMLHSDLFKDRLTGFYSNNFFQAEYSRYERSVNAMMLLNCDHIEDVMGQFGKQEHDRVLIVVANLIQQSIRTVDFPCRWDESHFIVLLPRTEVQFSKVVAQRIMNTALKCELSGVKLSIGIALAAKGENFRDVFGRADWAMYSAQVSDTNDVFVAE